MVPETNERNMELFRTQAMERGFRLFPVVGKKPKEGFMWKEYCQEHEAYNESDFIDRNAAVCCGLHSGVLVLDIDDPDAFELLAVANSWEVPDTYTVRTGGGGKHLYYRYPDDGQHYGNKSLKHPAWTGHTIFDVRGDGGYVVAAGSIHPDTGQVYSVEKDAEVSAAPDWLNRYVLGEDVDRGPLWDVPIPEAKASRFIESLGLSATAVQLILEGKPVGERSNAIRSVLLSLLQKGVPDRKIEFIFEQCAIGDKFRGKGRGRSSWLAGEIERARQGLGDQVRETPIESGSETAEDQYAQQIEQLNSEYAVVQLNGKTVIMRETVDPTFSRPDVHFLSIADFNHWFANQLVPDPSQPARNISIAKYWLTSPRRRQYQGIVFNPQGDMPGYYNLWRGFGVAPKPGDWSLMAQHILEVIAGGDQDICQYIIHWMADLVQNPGGKRPGVSIVLRGEQGTGKGCFVTNLGKIVGNHFLHITNQRQLTGRFNQHLKDALLVFVDEGIWAGNKEPEGILKAMITEDVLMIEPKGKEIFTVKNHVRLIFASNNQWVVPVGSGDRRFMVLDVSNAHARDRSWFDPIWRQMDNGGREAMLHDLLQVDLSGVHLRDFPRTEARFEQIVHSMSTIEKYWLDSLQTGKFEGFVGFSEAVGVKWLHDNFIEYANAIGSRYKPSIAEFGKALRESCPDMKRVRQTSGDREWMYHFPSLEKCRLDFEKKVGQSISWD